MPLLLSGMAAESQSGRHADTDMDASGFLSQEKWTYLLLGDMRNFNNTTEKLFTEKYKVLHMTCDHM